jgi:thiol-disulfide isomerase/thioredoxin
MAAVAIALAMVILGAAAYSFFARPPADKTAPDFTLPALDGSNVTLSALRGKAVFLDFMATWCPPCRKAFPQLASVHAKHTGQEVVFLSIDVDPADAGKLGPFAAQFNVTWPLLVDTEAVTLDYGIGSLPGYVAISRTGQIVASAQGDQGDAGAELFEQMVQKALTLP